VVAPSPSSFTDWSIMNDFEKIENMHKNDHGLDVGDRCFYMAHDWMPVECVVVSKQNSGMTRSFRLRMIEERTGGRAWQNTRHAPDDAWLYDFVTGVKKIAPIP